MSDTLIVYLMPTITKTLDWYYQKTWIGTGTIAKCFISRAYKTLGLIRHTFTSNQSPATLPKLYSYISSKTTLLYPAIYSDHIWSKTYSAYSKFNVMPPTMYSITITFVTELIWTPRHTFAVKSIKILTDQFLLLITLSSVLPNTRSGSSNI